MEKIELFLTMFYDKIMLYLNSIWSDIVNKYNTFDFTILAEVGFVLLMGYTFARTLSKYIPKLIKILGNKINFPIDNDFILSLRSFMFQLIFFSSILVVISMLDLSKSINFIAISITKSILFVSLIIFVFRVLKLILIKIANREISTDEDDTRLIQKSTLPLFENMLLVIFSLAGIYQVFSIWNIDMTAMLASAGIVAMGISMAAKDALSDLISGIFILTDAPYRVGDTIYVKDNLKGKVIRIGLRNTRLITRNNVEIIVPNNMIGTSYVINESSVNYNGLRIELDIYLSVNEEVSKIRTIILDAINSIDKIDQEKKKLILMVNFKDSMFQFRIKCWIEDENFKAEAKGELMELIYLKFLDEQMNIIITNEQHIALSIDDLPKQEIEITKFPQNELNIKEFPNITQDISIKEMPNLFGSKPLKKMTKVPKNQPPQKHKSDEI